MRRYKVPCHVDIFVFLSVGTALSGQSESMGSEWVSRGILLKWAFFDTTV